MNIYIICSVRNATSEYTGRLYEYVADLEAQGHKVHLPPRDTPQGGDPIEINKCNASAIGKADEIHVSYNANSTGTHFDLGMAFILSKKLVIFDIVDGPNLIGKSYEATIREWEKISKTWK